MSKPDSNRPPNAAAVYARTSTEHQRYSASGQSTVTREYARRRGLEIVGGYSDEAKSGVPKPSRPSGNRDTS